MGTKNNPGKFDCYAKAAPDEPVFTLRAKDQLAPDMVELWRALAIGDIYTAVEVFSTLTAVSLTNPHDIGFESEKADEASTCAEEMRKWRDQ